MVAESGREKGAVTNPDTGCAIPRSEGGYLSRVDFAEKKIFERFTRGKDGTDGFSAMWQADPEKIQRMAPPRVHRPLHEGLVGLRHRR